MQREITYYAARERTPLVATRSADAPHPMLVSLWVRRRRRRCDAMVMRWRCAYSSLPLFKGFNTSRLGSVLDVAVLILLTYLTYLYFDV